MNELKKFSSMTEESSEEMHKAMLNSLKNINEFFGETKEKREEFMKQARLAANIVSAFAKIKQAESGQSLVVLMAAKGICPNPEEFKDYIYDRLPHLKPTKLLKKN